MSPEIAPIHTFAEFLTPITDVLHVWHEKKHTSNRSQLEDRILEIARQIFERIDEIFPPEFFVPEEEKKVLYKFLKKIHRILNTSQEPKVSTAIRLHAAILLLTQTRTCAAQDQKSWQTVMKTVAHQPAISVYTPAWDLIVGKNFSSLIQSFDRAISTTTEIPELFLSDDKLTALYGVTERNKEHLDIQSLQLNSIEQLSLFGALVFSQLENITTADKAEALEQCGALASLFADLEKNPFRFAQDERNHRYNTALLGFGLIEDLPFQTSKEHGFFQILQGKSPKVDINLRLFFRIMHQFSPAQFALKFAIKVRSASIHPTSMESLYQFIEEIPSLLKILSKDDIDFLIKGMCKHIQERPFLEEDVCSSEHRQIAAMQRSLKLFKESISDENRLLYGKEIQNELRHFLTIPKPFFDVGSPTIQFQLLQNTTLFYELSQAAVSTELFQQEKFFTLNERELLKDLLLEYCSEQLDIPSQIIRIKGFEGVSFIHPLIFNLSCPEYAFGNTLMHTFKISRPTDTRTLDTITSTFKTPSEPVQTLTAKMLYKDGIYAISQYFMLPKKDRSENLSQSQILQVLAFFDFLQCDCMDISLLQSKLLMLSKDEKDGLEMLSEDPLISNNTILYTFLNHLILENRNELRKKLAAAKPRIEIDS